jgi:hypothetical protein
MSSSDDEDRVGFGRPPRHSRFRKGQSGNPKGRRKHKPSSGIARIAERKIAGTENGRTRYVTVEDGVAQRLAQTALDGDVAAAKTFLQLCEQSKRDRAAHRDEEPETPPVTFVVEHALSNALDALQILGAAVGNERRDLKLQPWLVEALRKRLGRPLTAEEEEIVQRGTRYAGSPPDHEK